MKGFHQMREEFFISIKLMWLGYVVYSLSNCVMKLYIETWPKYVAL